jgi:hypothetical protein
LLLAGRQLPDRRIEKLGAKPDAPGQGRGLVSRGCGKMFENLVGPPAGFGR